MTLSQIDSDDSAGRLACVSDSDCSSEILEKRSRTQFDSSHASQSDSCSLVDSDSRLFENLRVMLMIVFLNLPLAASHYDNCTELEKRLLTLILIKKYRLAQPGSTRLGIHPDRPLSFEAIDSLVHSKSTRRRNEMFNFIIRTFLKYQTQDFRRRQRVYRTVNKRQKLELERQFFECNFPKYAGRESEIQTIFSTFVKLSLRRNKHLDRYFGSNLEACKRNYGYKQCLSWIRPEGPMRRQFVRFLAGGGDSPIVRVCRSEIRNKIRNKIAKLREDYFYASGKSEREFLADFKTKLTRRSFKLPKLIQDVVWFSGKFLEQIQIDEG